ncbi:MAG: lysine--tRNA ligase [Candidatus Thermoplasmatota archaeon]|nr:lysine--tRNA ligase [Candidatus Thermoplasmatota archaeon]
MIDRFKQEKLKKMLDNGIDPYPYSFKQELHALDIKKDYETLKGTKTSIAGRAMSIRHMGQLYFIDILDASDKIQVLVSPQMTSAKSIALLDLIDMGDILGIRGIINKSKRGEISIEADEITVLSKSLSPMPEKFHGLSDTETRYRQRHLDLTANPETRRYFITRARILSYFRNFLDSRGYIEFETPILQPAYGGANAEPFVTRYRALDADFYLRVSDELYLKRLIIGGMEKVYEVCKDFRNEDIDSTHNPEFTQVEFYEAYKDYNDFMTMTEELLSSLVRNLFGSYKITYQGKELDFTPPFKRVYWVEEVKKLSGIDVSVLTDEESGEVARREGLKTSTLNAYHVADGLFDKYIKPNLSDPTFVLDFPAYMCPLTKDKRGNPKLSERFEVYIAGREEGNCYSELTDPVEQRKKFEDQERERQRGDAEAPPSDEDFLEAIEFGMPPTAGIGLSIDRLAMILTDNISIKELLAFPTMRPRK